jgi:hypothetical protein
VPHGCVATWLLNAKAFRANSVCKCACFNAGESGSAISSSTGHSVREFSELSPARRGDARGEVASTGSRAAGGEAQAPRLAGACGRQVRGFFGGALRRLACSGGPPLKKKKEE